MGCSSADVNTLMAAPVHRSPQALQRREGILQDRPLDMGPNPKYPHLQAPHPVLEGSPG